MTVYPVNYQIRSDKSLVKVRSVVPSRTFTFDDYYQMFSSEEAFKNQINLGVVNCIRNSTFYLFFVFGKEGTLHLFNSRIEVERFLRR